jgi:hypothetical protein
MKIDDLVESPLSKYGMGNPMGISQKIGAGLRSLAPGSTGARAKGELQTGKVANIWKKEYMNYVGRAGAGKHGSTETFISFLKSKKFTDDQIAKVMKGTLSEAALMYERALGVGEIDNLMLRAAKVAAASEFDPNAEIPDEPDPTAPRQPGTIDKAVGLGKKAAPHVAKAAGKIGTTIGQKALDYGKQILAKKAGIKTSQPDLRKDQFGRIEPSMGTPVPRNMPQLTKPTSTSAKFEPARKAPKMKVKPVRKFKED